MVNRTHALTLYALAILILVGGGAVAIGRFPGGYDWPYTVVSALASRKHNPEGGMWFSGALAVAMILLWPVAGHLDRVSGSGRDRPRVSLVALRVGLFCGVALGMERLLIFHLSDLVHKAHELLALLTFLGLYWGVLGLYVHRMRQSAAFLWPALLVVLPLFAVGTSQLALYLDQRDVGWVGAGWRELGIPIWLSFAFWQWMAVVVLLVGLGCLTAARHRGAQVDAAAARAVVLCRTGSPTS